MMGLLLFVIAVHPHGRGENGNTQALCNSRLRFTPTGVGKTATGQPRPVSAPVHPHGRGENAERMKHITMSCGSPPRAWGKHKSGNKDQVVIRFTPTGVGKTDWCQNDADYDAVHPHGRGENITASSYRAA